MPHLHTRPRSTRGAFLLLLFVLGGWGGTGHRIVNRNAPANLPPAMLGFLARAGMLADSSSNADIRKSDDTSAYYYSNKHFIDIDAYPEYATRSVTHSRDSLILQYGLVTVNENGTIPWATAAMVDSLTAQMSRGDWNRVWSTAADLGHYVADAHNPFHCTMNYNGQLSGNNGIHSRYESSMINTYQSSIVPVPGTASYVPRPIDYVFNYIYESLSHVDTLLRADTYARQAAGSYNSMYYSLLWTATGEITKLQFQRAVDALANLLYTAWVNAGQPPVPSVTSVTVAGTMPTEFRLEEPYPNPFNPETVIGYTISGGGGRPAMVTMKVYDISGREVATLAEGERLPGRYRVTWNAAGKGSGIYFLRLQGGTTIQTKRILLLK